MDEIEMELDVQVAGEHLPQMIRPTRLAIQ